MWLGQCYETWLGRGITSWTACNAPPNEMKLGHWVKPGMAITYDERRVVGRVWGGDEEPNENRTPM